MTRRLSIIAVMLIAGLTGCNPYPRYNPEGPTTPEAPQDAITGITSSGFIRFGLILQRYLGRPYKGTSRYIEGLDCSQFTQLVYEQYDKTLLPRTTDKQFEVGVSVPRPRLSFGDLVFFKTTRERVGHVGIYIGYNEFIHASTSYGVIITNMDETYWARRYIGARRVMP
jgi:cell wall-associated NlpC family hydrolase